MSMFSMAKLVMKSLFQKPATIDYPLRPAPVQERTRGHIEIHLDDCIFCGLCMRKCPTHAIGVTKEPAAWEIVRLHCIQCNSCVEVCPKHCLTMRSEPPAPARQERTERFARIPGDQADR